MGKNKKRNIEQTGHGKAGRKQDATGKVKADDQEKNRETATTGISNEQEAAAKDETLTGTETDTGTESSTEEKSYVAEIEEKLKEKEEKYLRLAAEFDNYRKRTMREKADLTKMVGGDIIAGMLPVIDDFDRAIDSLGTANDMEAVQKGILLIYDKFKEFLKQKGVREIPAMGAEFDTDLHEALTKIPAPAKKDKGKVVDVISKGYILHDRVIRYAKVVVGE